MTLINKIFIKNFKSFGKPTELLFGNRFNTVIGPNGSGKSNIFDAFCFVLGELSAKSMRAHKASNLIFNGGKQGSPSKEAEVSIHFDNKAKEFPIESEELKITRIIRQTGQSLYKINGEKRTRQQILELLSRAQINPDGHNIVLQGDIVSLTDMKPEGRREIIEEIAGISVYETKKQQSLNELNRVDGKINEAHIILTERATYLKELRKERDQAMKFKEYEQKLKENKATNVYVQIKDKNKTKEEIDGKKNHLQKQLDQINEKIKDTKKFIEHKKQEIEIINKEIEEKGEKKQINLQREIEELNTTVVRNTSRQDSCKSEISKIKERKIQLQKDLEEISIRVNDLNKQKNDLNKELVNNQKQEKELTKQIQKFKSKHKIKDISMLDNIDKNIEEKQNNFIKLQEEKQSIQRDKYRLDLDLENTNKIIEASSSKEAKEIENKLTKIESELSNKTSKFSIILTQTENSKNKANKTYEELQKLKTKQSVFQDSLSYDIAVNKLINSKKQGVYGIIAQLGTVDKQYSTAIEVAAGSRAKSLVVENDQIAADCIKFLKQNRLGVVTFLPLNKLKERPKLNIKKPGVVGTATDLITYDKKYSKAFSYVFGSTLIVKDVETARRIGNARRVTLEGDLFESTGVIVGGFRRSRGITFKEKDADLKIERLEKELSLIKTEIKTLDSNKSKHEQEIQSLKNLKSELTGDLIKFQKVNNIEEIDRIKERKENTLNQLKTLQSQIKEIDSNLKINTKELEVLKKQRLQFKSAPKIKNQKVMLTLSEIENKYENTRMRTVQINSEIKNIEEQTERIHLPEKEKIESIVKQHNRESEEFDLELKELTNNLIKQNKDLEEKRKQEVNFYNEYKNLFANRNKLNEEVQKQESKISTEDFKTKELERRVNEINIKRAKVVAELEGLNTEFEEFKGIKLRKNTPREQIKLEIQKYEKALTNMGNVNLKALEIYTEIESEYEQLTQKMDTLRSEKEDVLKMMQEIETKKKSIFMKTFKAINENFKKTFIKLSTKGDAYLDLENKEDPLSEGIEIKVRLAGTKFLDIKSLSGGEKTMTAIAFIFAIQEFQPASFYLLDEVDAALDKTNSALLAKLIQTHAGDAQYIMVSHNDNIISGADQIYGASMQKNGITKVVSLKI